MIDVGTEKLLGLFELDEEGGILYSSFEANDGSMKRQAVLDGSNFFADVASFTNVGDFQRRFQIFCVDAARTTSFRFCCQYADGPHDVQIVMARLTTTTGPPSFLVHFRKP